MPVEEAARALLVVPGDGDLRIAHAVADQQDDVAGARAADGVPDGVGLVSAEPSGAAVGRQFALRGAAEGIADRLLLLVAAASREHQNSGGADARGGSDSN